MRRQITVVTGAVVTGAVVTGGVVTGRVTVGRMAHTGPCLLGARLAGGTCR